MRVSFYDENENGNGIQKYQYSDDFAPRNPTYSLYSTTYGIRDDYDSPQRQPYHGSPIRENPMRQSDFDNSDARVPQFSGRRSPSPIQEMSYFDGINAIREERNAYYEGLLASQGN